MGDGENHMTTDAHYRKRLKQQAACSHGVTQGRKGEEGSWCEKCGLKIYDVDPRGCKDCAHFKDLGPTQDNHCICKHHPS